MEADPEMRSTAAQEAALSVAASGFEAGDDSEGEEAAETMEEDPGIDHEKNWTKKLMTDTYCSNMARSGMNPKTLQYLMGHSDIGVTMNVYTHLGLDDVKDEMIRMEELEQAKKEVQGEKNETPVSQKMFKVI